MSILRWTNKSLKKLKKILKDMKGIDVCEHVIADVLHHRGYALQANKKNLNEMIRLNQFKWELQQFANETG